MLDTTPPRNRAHAPASRGVSPAPRRRRRQHGPSCLALCLACLILAIALNPAPAWENFQAGGFPFGVKEKSPSLDGGSVWLNVPGPLSVRDLHGKFVLLDFWTSCCINCMHILPELKKLEHAWPKNLVVIGVHSGKFANERDTENIREAILRYEIEHPVVNDPNLVLWNKFGVDTWPSLRLIDPEGNLVTAYKGEVQFGELDEVIRKSIGYYRRKGVLVDTPLKFNFEKDRAQDSPLRFPGKLLAHEASDRLFIADSNHNRIVVTHLDGTLMDVIGSGAIGRADGAYDNASFDHPQGLALVNDLLYVADTENHLLRKIDLKSKQVSTAAGTGKMRRDPNAGVGKRHAGLPAKSAMNSPWALCAVDKYLYIAMAGPHQIWRMDLEERQLELYAGTGTEDIIDGPLLTRGPKRPMTSCFAQPSGLAAGPEWLYVADSEGSSIRAVPFDTKREVTTIVGTAQLPPADRLFTFGDQDGGVAVARLQHPLDVAYANQYVYVADTYNSKIKVIDLQKMTVETIAGGGVAPDAESAAAFDEPAGLSIAGKNLYVADTNNHRVRVIDLEAMGNISTLEIDGLTPPAPQEEEVKPSFVGAKQVKVSPVEVGSTQREIRLALALELPEGFEMNSQIPMKYWIEANGETGPIRRASLKKLTRLEIPTPNVEISLPLDASEGNDTLKVSLAFYYCSHGDGGVCKFASVVWTVPLHFTSTAEATTARLEYRVR